MEKRMIQNGINEDVIEYEKVISRFKKLSYKELNELLLSDKKEDKEKFINGYLRYVVKYAKKLYSYFRQKYNVHFTIMDFIQLGNELLVNLAYNYNHTNIDLFTYKFAKEFKRLIIKKVLGICPRLFVECEQYMTAADEFYKKNKREATNLELQQILGVSEDRLNSIITFLKYNLLNNNQYVMSDNQLQCVGIEEPIYSKLNQEDIIQIFEELCFTPREIEFLVKYFGLTTEDYEGQNLTNSMYDIASEYNVSRQRVEQLIKRSLIKIKGNKGIVERISRLK